MGNVIVADAVKGPVVGGDGNVDAVTPVVGDADDVGVGAVLDPVVGVVVVGPAEVECPPDEPQADIRTAADTAAEITTALPVRIGRSCRTHRFRWLIPAKRLNHPRGASTHRFFVIARDTMTVSAPFGLKRLDQGAEPDVGDRSGQPRARG
jgi:hypothetical protein